MGTTDTIAAPQSFLHDIIEGHLREGRYPRIVTRFPPEPNGYLHIGHAKSIVLNFSLAQKYGGACHLRMDDTNPTTEDMEYVEAIQRDVRWLGYDWGDKMFYASDYFERIYDVAVHLVKKGLAYVCELSEEQIREYRGTVTEPGKPSPYRERGVRENLDLLARMRAGEMDEGAAVLRAKIDMAAANMKMRDPLLYRIKKAPHYRRGQAWCIYPMYDFAHCLSDAFEGITHSICTLEFENNRELYDWLIAAADVQADPHQYEFARLNLTYTVMSKRKLLELVRNKHVQGWDDPRMPTLAGLRRRGYTPAAIRNFCERIGVAKANSTVEVEQLEHAVRDDLNQNSPRVLCVLDPLKVVLTNYPEGKTETLNAPYFPHDVPKEGSRDVPFSRQLYIERDDFMENPPKDFHRLVPGGEVRLRYAYVIRCDEVIKDAAGRVTELRCSYDPESRGGKTADGRKVKGTIHWVDAARALPCSVRLYDRLFAHEKPDQTEADFKTFINPASLQTLSGCKIEPSVGTAKPGDAFQFERHGFFCADLVDCKPGALVFNRTVSLRDSWAKAVARADEPARPTKAATNQAATPPRDKAPKGKPEAERSPAEQQAFALYTGRHGLTPDDADTLARHPELQALFTQAVAAHPNPTGVANWLVNDVLRELKARAGAVLPFDGAAIGELVAMVDGGEISSKAAKDVLAELFKSGGAPRAVVERKGLRQISDPKHLEPLVQEVLAAHPDSRDKYQAGKTNVLGFLVGQVIGKSQGRADPKLVDRLVRARLE